MNFMSDARFKLRLPTTTYTFWHLLNKTRPKPLSNNHMYVWSDKQAKQQLKIKTRSFKVLLSFFCCSMTSNSLLSVQERVAWTQEGHRTHTKQNRKHTGHKCVDMFVWHRITPDRFQTQEIATSSENTVERNTIQRQYHSCSLTSVAQL